MGQGRYVDWFGLYWSSIERIAFRARAFDGVGPERDPHVELLRVQEKRVSQGHGFLLSGSSGRPGRLSNAESGSVRCPRFRRARPKSGLARTVAPAASREVSQSAGRIPNIRLEASPTPIARPLNGTTNRLCLEIAATAGGGRPSLSDSRIH